MYYQQPFVRHSTHSVSQARSKPNIMRVSGEGKIAVQPSQSIVTLGVSTEDQVLQKAQENNAQAIANIKNALNNIGILDQQIRTADFSIFPQYDFVDGKQVFRGYKVEHVLGITVDDIENTGLVVDTAVDSGANLVRGITFEMESQSFYYQQALTLAVADAYKKAETIAAALRVQLVGTPLSVTEGAFDFERPVPYQPAAFVKSEVSTPIQPGTIDITSRVSAEFMYYS
ncbi:SIMPL domain-containing protein [Bacillus sp. ISL-47]|uniref:SIMPL domain-containing protein n=1 Tax=Bacillus sp. ISL-47 TaxID=2819130 RepID=UPI001BE81D1A|nr:SIMPL domain-containing protein [Bacillus sp. ISL-47]MBT2687054.1 SIMPL domain-containing protein [Bacillus sp. ISL-47]MBT2707354.1 SIMPL domain-containing protein [Pseudomonas sp. ISL-84]